MLEVVAYYLLACISAWLITLWVYHNSGSWNLLQPSNHRSSHIDPTPFCGGIGFVLATTIIVFWMDGWHSPNLIKIFLLAMVLAIVGLADDIWVLAVKLRLIVHFLVLGALVYITDPMPQVIQQFGIFPADIHSPGITLLLASLVVLAGVWWINLFNFMDGIDGLAAAQAITMLLSAATLVALDQPSAIAQLNWKIMVVIASAVLGFLAMNLPPARIFMGDVGSTWLAFIIFSVALLTIEADWLNFAVWLILGSAFISDASVTLITRVIHGERLFEAHRSHAYQVISLKLWSGFEQQGSAPGDARGRAQTAVIVTVLAINLFWLLPIALLVVYQPQLTVPGLVLAYLPLVIAVLRIRREDSRDSALLAGQRQTDRAPGTGSPRLGFMMITRQAELARLAENCGIGRIFVDLEILGKFERQGHLDTHISDHSIEDVALVKSVLRQAELLVRVNPLNPDTAREVDLAIDGGANILMLPMYRRAEEVRAFVELVKGRVKVMPLLETVDAMHSLNDVVKIPGVTEIYIGLNDLHLDMGLDFIFEPLANGTVDRLVATIKQAGLPFGFGGVARVDEGTIPGNLILAEHLRLGSSWVILSRTFQLSLLDRPMSEAQHNLNAEIGRFEERITELRKRDPARIEADRRKFRALVENHVAAQREKAGS